MCPKNSKHTTTDRTASIDFAARDAYYDEKNRSNENLEIAPLGGMIDKTKQIETDIRKTISDWTPSFSSKQEIISPTMA